MLCIEDFLPVASLLSPPLPSPVKIWQLYTLCGLIGSGVCLLKLFWDLDKMLGFHGLLSAFHPPSPRAILNCDQQAFYF